MSARRGWIRQTSEELREMMKEIQEQWERDEPKRKAEEAQREAEMARRASLHPTERLAEDGAKLRQDIESNDDMLAVLEVSRSARAGCRAGDCFYAPRIDIGDMFRVRVDGVRGELEHYRTKHYYHVLEAMIDVEDMISSGKFVCDGGQCWGLIVRAWFRHRGRINPDVLVQYIKDRNDWEKKDYGGPSAAVAKALFATEERGTNEGTKATAGGSASVPETIVTSGKEDDPPVLQGYVINEPWISLSYFLRLPEIWEGQVQLIQHPWQFPMLQAVESWPDVYEELEAEEYGPKTEEEVNRESEQHKNRLDQKRQVLRMVWDKWHAPAIEDPNTSGLVGDDAKQAEAVVVAVHKRGRSRSADGEESGDKRQKIQGKIQGNDETEDEE